MHLLLKVDLIEARAICKVVFGGFGPAAKRFVDGHQQVQLRKLLGVFGLGLG